MKASRASYLIALVLLLVVTSTPAFGATPAMITLDRGWTSSLVAPPAAGMHFSNAQVVAGGPGLVTLGTEGSVATSPPSQQMALWTSADGQSWHAVNLDPSVFPENAQVNHMAAGLHGIVLTGFIQPTGPSAIWSSPDGEHWSRAAIPAASDGATTEIGSVAAGEAGFAAIGRDLLPPSSGQNGTRPYADVPVVLTSTDGLTWRRVPGIESTFANVELTEIVAGGAGFVLAGLTGAFPSETVSYTSHNGVTWSGPYPLPPEQAGLPAAVDHLFAGSGIVVALREAPNSGQRAYASTDGKHWQTSAWQGVPGTTFMDSITSLDGLLVGLGTSAGTAAIWTSADGLDWTQTADDQVFKSSRTQQIDLRSIVSYEGGLDAVGFVLPSGTGRNCFPQRVDWSFTAWRWTPQTSQAAPPPPKPSPLDPRAFSLRSSDMPPGTAAYAGGYVSVCATGDTPGPFSLALGKYAAYENPFESQPGENVESITIVAASAKAAHAALLLAPTYFSVTYFHPGKPRELRMTKRIGAESRLFDTHIWQLCDCSTPAPSPAGGVIWRSGRDLGIVVVSGAATNSQDRADALRFAAAQDAHLRQLSG